MQDVHVGVVGTGNVGLGTLQILAENSEQIARKLGFGIKVAAVCSPNVSAKQLPVSLNGVRRLTDWRELVADPSIDIVCELIGGTKVAADLIQASIAAGKSVVTARSRPSLSCSGASPGHLP